MKNIHFTQLIKIRGLLREVNFRRLPGEPVAYHVDLTDERGHRFVFTMKKDAEGLWTCDHLVVLPDWIREAEELLAAALEKGIAPVEDDRNRAS